MTPEELAAIRDRDAEPMSGSMRYQVQCALDRTALLAEVDRLRALLVEVGDTYDFEIDLTTGELT